MHVIGHKVFDRHGKPKADLTGFTSHRDAMAGAEETRKAGGSALRPTAHVTIALNFNDAETYVRKLDVDAARRELLAAATTLEEVAEVQGMKPGEFPPLEVRAKKVDHEVHNGNKKYAAGSMIVDVPGARPEVWSANEFHDQHDLKKGKK